MAVTVIGLVVGYHSKIFGALEALADFIRGLGPFRGPLAIMLCLFATSFPPIIGYSSIVTMSGYVYGFLFGFVIAFSGALAGGIVCFFFCRKWFKPQVRKLMAKNKSLKSVVRTVEKRGFRLLVLIRLAPYPYNIMNALLSATHIPLLTFALATGLSLLKLTLHVYIGSTLSSLTEGDDDDNTKNPDGTPKDPDVDHGSKRLKFVFMILGIIFGIGIGAYVWWVARQEVAITEAARIQRRRKRRQQSLRHALDEADAAAASTGNFGREHRLGRGGGGEVDGIELNEQGRGSSYIPGLDLTSRDVLEHPSNLVGGWRSGDHSGTAGYADDEDEDGQEDQSLFRPLGGRFGRHQQRGPNHGDEWRNVGANVDSATDSEDDDDDSDFTDDDGDDDDDLEQDHGYRDQGQGLDHAEGGYGYRDGDGIEQQPQQFEEPALDFSAHHAGLMDSPWQDNDEEDDGRDGAEPGGFLVTGMISPTVTTSTTSTSHKDASAGGSGSGENVLGNRGW
ncbi:hypothetical protein EDD11_010509 [Mortierella claussenii]|nr:hypothetical protein EDD11_010509 [Mortierella claussenii]